MPVATEETCETCGASFWLDDVDEGIERNCEACRAEDLVRRTRVFLSDGKDLQGPIGCQLIRQHPNLSKTFRITDPEWLVKLGWGPTAYVEIQAYVLAPGVKTPRDTYWWYYSLV